MVLPLDTSKVLRTPAELRSLVERIREAPESEQETGWLEWKSHLDLVDRGVRAAVRATLAKGILGFANREPSEARRAMEGVAYFVVGVEPQKLTGVELVDSADLEAQLEPYVGIGPRWTPTYVTLDDTHVLVITVEAPVSGDPPYPACKTFQPQSGGSGFDDGTLFIRRGAKTGRATSSEISMLVRRAQAPDQGRALDVAVELDQPADGVKRFAHSEAAVEAFVEPRRIGYLEQLPVEGGYGGWSRRHEYLVSSGLSGDSRSAAQFRASVERYADELTAHVLRTLPARALGHGVGEVTFAVRNPSATAFKGVEVSVEFQTSAVVGVYGFHGDLEVDDEPAPPRDYGTRPSRFPAMGGLAIGTRHLPPVRPFNSADVEVRGDRTTVTYEPVDVRAEGTVRLRPIWVLLDENAPAVLTARWQAAALDADKRLSGELQIDVSDDVWPVDRLMSKPPRD